ncbi:MAG: hypothetical protein GEU99_01935 [Luteitalea sp.]|nr:hypothetical protein [Luteitalea sp.]
MRPRVLVFLSLLSVVCLVGVLAFALRAPVFAQIRDTAEVDQGTQIPYVDEHAAQPATSDPPPPSVSDVDGSAQLIRRDQEEALSVGIPLIAGDSIVTDGGRVELVWGNGSVISVDEGSRLDLLSDDLIRLVGGRVRIELPPDERVDQPGGTVPFRVDTPDASVHLRDAGDYRIEASWDATAAQADRATMVAVLRGNAEVVHGDDRAVLTAGERVVARLGEPLAAMTFNVAQFDAFDTWVDARQRNRQDSASASHLPSELAPYGPSFDVHGTWRRDPTYGSVWYPRAHSGWRPYFDGGWRYYPTYGWTWISASPWGWATHHYGRWGIGVGGAWFWIPARRWSTAWVYWAWTPSYVGWTPLGWNGRPLVAFGSWRSGYGRGYRHGYFHGRRDAWSVVRWNHFGHRRLDRRYAVRVTDVDWGRSRVTGGRALPRAVTRTYASRSVAVPRHAARSIRPGSRESVRQRSRGAVPRTAERARVLDSRASSVVTDRGARSRSSRDASRTLDRARPLDRAESRAFTERRAQPRTARPVSPSNAGPGPSSRVRAPRYTTRPSVRSNEAGARRAVPRVAPRRPSVSSPRASSRARSAPQPRPASSVRSARPRPGPSVKSAPRSRPAPRARSAPRGGSAPKADRGGSSRRRAVRRK